MTTLRLVIKQTTNDETNPFLLYIPPFLGVKSETCFLISAVIHHNKIGKEFGYMNQDVAQFCSCSAGYVRKMIKASVNKGWLSVTGSGKSRKLHVTKELLTKISKSGEK